MEREQYITVVTSNQKDIDKLEKIALGNFDRTKDKPLRWKCKAKFLPDEARKLLVEIFVEDSGIYSDLKEVFDHVSLYALYYNNGSEYFVMFFFGLGFLALTWLVIYLLIRKKRRMNEEKCQLQPVTDTQNNASYEYSNINE